MNLVTIEVAQTKACAGFKHHLDECTERVLSGKTLIKGEDCVEELCTFDLLFQDRSHAKAEKIGC